MAGSTQQVSALGRFSDVVLGGSLRLLGLTLSAKAILPAAEIGIRILSTGSSMLTGHPENRMGPRDQASVEKELNSNDVLTKTFAHINSLRGENMYKESSTLVKECCSYFLAAMAINEFAFRTLGQPIELVNVVGRFLGLQMLPDGIYHNLPSMDLWRNAFARMESRV